MPKIKRDRGTEVSFVDEDDTSANVLAEGTFAARAKWRKSNKHEDEFVPPVPGHVPVEQATMSSSMPLEADEYSYTKTAGGGIGRGWRLGPRSYRRAARGAVRMMRKYPAGKFGRVFIERGTPLSRGMFGADLASATAAQQQRRKDMAFTGKGGYFGRLIGGALGAKFGQAALGASLGDKFGDFVGSHARSLAGRYFSGRGDYTNTNSIVEAPGGDQMPGPAKFTSVNGSDVQITHEEYIQDIVAPSLAGAFDMLQFPLNPGLEGTFPWLSQVAANYEEYELKQCIFTYRSTTTDIGSSTTGQCGTIIAATDYNPAHPAFYDKPSMLRYDGSQSQKTTEHLMHGVECDPRKLSGSAGKFIRTTPIAVTDDIKSYDVGTTCVAVANLPAGFSNQAIGELWVSYTVVLRKPKLVSNFGGAISRDYFVNRFPNSASFQNPFAGALGATDTTSLLRGAANSIGCRMGPGFGATGVDTIFFPPGYSGTVSIRMVLLSDSANAWGAGIGGAPTLAAWTSADGSTLSTSGSQSIKFAADMQAIDDSWSSKVYSISSTGAGSLDALMVEWHVRISPPVAGVPNNLTFSTGLLYHVNNPCRNAVLDIQEYNATGLIVAPSGALTGMQLVNNLGLTVA